MVLTCSGICLETSSRHASNELPIRVSSLSNALALIGMDLITGAHVIAQIICLLIWAQSGYHSS